MGFFSWKTSDTNKSISNNCSVYGALPVYLITPQNEKIYEDDYEGYGIFGGYDAYALLAKWNVPEQCNDDVEHDRLIGIELFFDNLKDDGSTNLKYPLKFAENKNANYDELPPSVDCPSQGFFYDDWNDDDDEW